MKNWILGGAACAALMGLAQPAFAAASSELPTSDSRADGIDQAVSGFYASRSNAPLWLNAAQDFAAAREFIAALRRASLDGLASGPALAADLDAKLARAVAGDPAARAGAERLLSTAWTLYVSALQTPTTGMTVADNWVAPRRDTPGQILARAAAAGSLAGHVRAVSGVNPVYAQLRDAAWNSAQATGGQADARVLASLDRARAMPFQKRYVMVDAASARLFMIENGRIADSMKVIVGTPEAPTPMLASTIYFATVNPYWHVTPELVRSLIAPNVLQQGVSYLQRQGYQVQSAAAEADAVIDPATIDWNAVADGRQQVRVRQLPGPANSMGRVKFGFPNAGDIYLHDTPVKEKFAAADRSLSHGCIRLEDAQRLERWMLNGASAPISDAPEQHIQLPTPVPIFITYLTAQSEGGQLSFVSDVYGRDATHSSQVAALR
ncbi:MAG: L,D-transpeptidase family protein [Sphingomicrobium sp.]